MLSNRLTLPGVFGCKNDKAKSLSNDVEINPGWFIEGLNSDN